MAIDRLNELVLSPNGTRLIASVSQLDEDGAEYVSSLWELDCAGVAAARRLTRSKKGETGPAFLPDGSLLFRSGPREAARIEYVGQR